MLDTPYTRWQGDQLHGRTPKMTPVWVRLDTLFPPLPDSTRATVADGLLLSGTVPGLLHGWFRSSTGAWLGAVNYEIRYADSRSQTVWLADQLVPREALTPRDDAR